jgi:hypothetical protein
MYDGTAALGDVVVKLPVFSGMVIDPAFVKELWTRHRARVLAVGVALLALASLRNLQWGLDRLLWSQERIGAIDLKLRHTEVQTWFAGQPVYGPPIHSCYPPASFPLLWPFVGWLEITPTRWLWAVSAVVLLAWLSYLCVRESGAQTRLERLFAALLPVSISGVGLALATGQLPLHVLPVLVAGLSLLHRTRGRLLAELGGAAWIVVALVKPNIAAPFFWIVLFVPGTLRPAVLVVAGYVALTLFASAFQPVSLATLLTQLAGSGSFIGANPSAMVSYGTLHTWAGSLGFGRWNSALSFLALGALGVWTFLHRRSDVWLLIGVAGVVSRIWTYHGIYDDVLIVLPMLALFRLAKQSPPTCGTGVWAGVLLALTTLAMATPMRVWQFPPPWCWFFTIGHAVVWLGVLIFLMYCARRTGDCRAEPQAATSPRP